MSQSRGASILLTGGTGSFGNEFHADELDDQNGFSVRIDAVSAAAHHAARLL